MKRQLLFVHGGGEGAYEEDRKMAASLRDALGGYKVQSPKMPDEDSPQYGASRTGRLTSMFCMKTSRRSSPKACRCSSTTVATTRGCRSHTSRSMRKRFRMQDSASSMDADISSTTIC